MKRFRHLDYDHLVGLLELHRSKYRRVIIVTESVFSMDGDVADLKKLVEIRDSYTCLLYVDEAHAVGVFGDQGLGKCEEIGIVGDVDFLVGTFGKAFASVGAYVLCSATVRDALINRSRSFIFTTMLPPVVVHWNGFILKKVMEMQTRREKLRNLSSRLRKSLESRGLQTRGETHIVPVIIGENDRTVALAEKMREKGFYILPVRPPTVPLGTARFRLSLSANMEWPVIAEISDCIAEGLRQHEK